MFRSCSSANRSQRRGAVAVWVAVSLVVLLGVAAISLDGGVLLAERRHAQSTADAAALAAASDMYHNYWAYNGTDSGGTAKQSALLTAANLRGAITEGTIFEQTTMPDNVVR